MPRPSDEEFRAELRGLLERTGLSMRGLSAAFGRDPGYVAALLDPSRPSRARPTPDDLLAVSDATGIAFIELLECLWGIPQERLTAEAGAGEKSAAHGPLERLDDVQRREVADFAAFIRRRAGSRPRAR